MAEKERKYFGKMSHNLLLFSRKNRVHFLGVHVFNKICLDRKPKFKFTEKIFCCTKWLTSLSFFISNKKKILFRSRTPKINKIKKKKRSRKMTKVKNDFIISVEYIKRNFFEWKMALRWTFTSNQTCSKLDRTRVAWSRAKIFCFPEKKKFLFSPSLMWNRGSNTSD